MSGGVFLSRFTPSLLSPETLEAIFVQRERLASSLVERIRSSALTPSKHYSLVIGPRGIGKTHLVSLVYHRVKGDDQLSDRLLCAWLREEEWGITSFLDFLISILRTLSQDLEDPRLEAEYQRLFELEAEQAELAAEQLLLKIGDGRTLLVIVENLDEVFEGMGETGQEKLRAYIQNQPCWTILGTSQSLFRGVSLQDSPFYGFFEVTHLQELSFEDAVTLLINIAQHHGERDLAKSLQTTLGRSRIRAVHHLAAGNPRVYVILSQFLTSRSLDQIVEPLMQTLDDLTPYYQARMSYLSPQQRKLVEFLCERWGAVSVKEIAKRNFLTHPTTSGQLKRLRELGYVRPARVGKESFFELREPLMRLCLEVKRQRGEPIRLFVDFLRMWFSQDELRKRLADLGERSHLDKRYLVRAMESYAGSSKDPRIEACLNDYEHFWSKDDHKKALQVAEELVEIRGFTSDLMKRSECLDKMGEGEAAERTKRQALILRIKGIEAQLDRAEILFKYEFDKELVDFTEQILIENSDNAEAWRWRAAALAKVGRYEESLKAHDRSIELNPEDRFVWNNRGVTLEYLQRWEKALASYDRALEIAEDHRTSLMNRVGVLFHLRRFEEALLGFDRLLKFYPKDEKAHNRLWALAGICQYRQGQLEDSLESLGRALAIEPENSGILSNRAVALSSLGRHEEALVAFDQAIELLKDSSGFHDESNRAVTLMHLNRWTDGRQALDQALTRFSELEVKEDSGEIAIVRNMLIRTQHEETWRRHIAIWIEVFERHDRLTLLGQGLVRTIRTLTIPWISNEMARRWNSVWQDLGAGNSGLAISLRLFDAAVRYRESGDERVLLSLPAEERALLEPLLGQSQE